MITCNRVLGTWNNLACTYKISSNAPIKSLLLTEFRVYWSILSVIILSIVLLATSEKTAPEFVFGTFENETGWTDGVAWMLGLLQSSLSLIGFDAVLHMTEEMPRPSEDAPRAMIYAIGVGGTT